MDPDDIAGPSSGAEWCRKCTCGKRLYQPNSYTNHIRTCSRYKRGVGSTLEAAKSRWKERGPQLKKGKAALNSWFGDEDLDIDKPIRPKPAPVQSATLDEHGTSVFPSEPVEMEIEQEALPRAESAEMGRGRRMRKPIKRFKDFALTSTIPFQIPSIPAHNLETSDGSDSESGHEAQVQESEDPSRPPVYFGPETEPQARRLTIFDKSSWKETDRNPFGLYKKYWTLENAPHDPDFYTSPEDLQDTPPDPSLTTEIDWAKELFPFPNLNSFLLGEWYWSDGNEKSRDSFRDLIGIITSADFRPDDIREANWGFINDSLASSEYDAQSRSTLDWMGDGTSWHTTSIQLDVPCNSTSIQPGVYHYEVPDFRYRPLVPIIKRRLEDATRGDRFHIVPTDLRWKPQEGGPDLRVYGELYNSPAFIQAFEEVQSLPPEPTESGLPRYVVALMFASDETMLTSFGSAKIWPAYMLFGNESKYSRAKPSLKLFEEIAYFQPLPDRFQDWYLDVSGKKNVGDTLYTFLNRELFHAQWKILLDNDFVHAYHYGIVVDSFDGVRRRFYPRILTYSADYPERAAVVSIRSNGDHPCPRCLVSDTDIHDMGSDTDRAIREEERRQDNIDRKNKIEKARKIIYTDNLSVNTEKVETLLKPTSLVPTKNAFSERLSELGLDVYRIVAVDILHEVEIGVWKSLFIHLLRLLETIDKSKLNVLNARFRDVPGFGRDTIRRFGNNVSEMKQFAARNYEDLLQCAIPAFEGLLPGDHDGRVLDLLFVFAHWHSLAKLRLHTDDTLTILDNWTTILGDECRNFVSETCKVFETRELKREYQSRKRNEARKKSKKKGKAVVPSHPVTLTTRRIANLDPTEGAAGMEINEGRKSKTWNINTPKFHSLGDVPFYIRMFGTTDSYSTQLSEHFHRFPKSRYKRTNKRKAPYQISRIQTRQARIRKLRKNLIPPEDEGSLDADGLSTLPHFIGKSQNQPLQLSRFLSLSSTDRAAKDFMPKLKRHLLPRIIEKLLQEARLSPEDHGMALPILEKIAGKPEALTDIHFNHLFIHSERIYQHSIAQFNFTTYDCRRDQDTLNASTSRRDLICFAEESPFEEEESITSGATTEQKRFAYARLLGTFHANIVYLGPGTLDHRQRRLDFLWIRWYRPHDLQSPESRIWESRRLEVVSLMPLTDSLACDFLDPSRVVRAAHIIPRYSAGKRYSPADHTTRIFSHWANDKEEWLQYYINPFADRDMMMRFHWGLAVGHAYSHPEDDVSMPTSPATGITVPRLPEDRMDVDNNTPSERDGGSSASTKSSRGESPSEEETDSDDSAYDRRDEDSNLSSGTSGWNSEGETERWDTDSQDGDSEDLDL